MVPCTVHIFCLSQNNNLRASVQPFCQNMCRFLKTTPQEFQVAGAVHPEEQCTDRVLQSAFHYPALTTMHGNFLIYNYFPKNSTTYYSFLLLFPQQFRAFSGQVPHSLK
ncbi:hypothetical protein T4A_5506 [Trichinella pseudospiralis]|uniref:Uncharacterized protein n=1 Tax=Trichinella pseudospiralis TaxID=6337 RepID=A0A0V1DQE5_TRIPS|nr:hypothetical protein T4A_5506 [Trichinella pseudospiralis]